MPEQLYDELSLLVEYKKDVIGNLVWSTDVYDIKTNRRIKFKNQPVALNRKKQFIDTFIYNGERVRVDYLVYFLFNKSLPKEYETIVHLDSNKSNNLIENLSVKCFTKSLKMKKSEKYKQRVLLNKSNELERKMLTSAKKRALEKGIIFDLTLDDILIPEYCPILKIRLEKKGGSPTPNSPSLDRFDPKKGYTKDNVWVISFKANCMKSNASLSDLILFAEWVFTITKEFRDDDC